ncbi:type IV conjugative transfer system protein TraK [Enterobacter hormaechei]|nr:type-F conjugative transfer system secretin TraK [Enterobacter hormaechei]SAF91516.1 type IV conjugative transfer system protein TraK [Enterobacter hormaechei]SAH30572.1 type IV conjugative transfer system protein TraK [Enterobacter hormaechei]SAI17965.1 type IV conjugative transfer system protein TraK [Enterobacter hormaechei]
MKFRISPAAAAVFLAAGLFTSGLRAASAPAAIPFENDAAFNVTLSNTNPSKVVVDGELITSISGPTGAYDQSQTEDGALILSPLVGQNFTLFIQTDRGSSLSLNVRPQPGNGKTLRFTPMSPPLRKNDDAKTWEEGQTYEKTLVALSRAVVNGQVPDDYQEYPVIVSTLTDEQNVQQQRELMLADLVRNEESGRSRQPEPLLAEVPQEEVIRLKPEDINPRKPEPLNPDADVIARVRGEENTDGQEIKAAAGVRSELEGADKTSGELSRASRVIADLANAERDMVRAAENTERGRTPEREEQTLTRTIQKER